MSLEDTVDKVKKDFLKEVIELLKSGKMGLEEVKQSTKEFLSLNPFESFDSLKNKLRTFTDKYEFFRPVYMTVLQIEEDKKTSELLKKMRGYIKENKIDQSVNLVQ